MTVSNAVFESIQFNILYGCLAPVRRHLFAARSGHARAALGLRKVASRPAAASAMTSASMRNSRRRADEVRHTRPIVRLGAGAAKREVTTPLEGEAASTGA